MDRLKQDIVNRVQDLVKDAWNDSIWQNAEREVEVSTVDSLSVRLRVKTPQGPRYFTIKVSEHY